jgi:hypothetical protein
MSHHQSPQTKNNSIEAYLAELFYKETDMANCSGGFEKEQASDLLRVALNFISQSHR